MFAGCNASSGPVFCHAEHRGDTLQLIPPPADASASTLQECIRSYRNDAQCNEALFKQFTECTDAVPLLRLHRDLVERNAWGHGDRAFHFLWYLIFRDLAAAIGTVRCCEIGVYKGQVISLWSRLAEECGVTAHITAISPFEGNACDGSGRWWDFPRRLLNRFSRQYRDMTRSGSLYPREDYMATVRHVFSANGLDSRPVTLLKGYSQDAHVLAQVRGAEFDLLYIDGDHTYPAVKADIEEYAPLVCDGGYLIMDDAASDLPGSGYFKGYPGVARACGLLPDLGFANVLNVGHNRLFQKRPRGR